MLDDRTNNGRMAAWAARTIASGTLLAVGAALIRLVTYVDPGHKKVADAGYVEKTAQGKDVTLNYVEGPANGPPLVLLHAQFLDWFSYSRVLPALAKSFHVFAIDYPGHGKTIIPADYPMTASRIGADLSDFIEKHIGLPVYVTGNSSGGLLATWLAANRPDLVRAALLEDPPLFSAEYPRIKRTIADRAFQTSYTAATRDHPTDFLLYWINRNAAFFRKNLGPGVASLLAAAIRTYRWVHPGKPPEIGILPNATVRMLVRGLDQYDPRFGAAFYDGTWNTGFDHARALEDIRCPVLLMQANTSTLPDGTLNGAMCKDDAEHAMSLLRHGTYRKVNASHVVNLAKPQIFFKTLESFFLKHGANP